MLVLKLEIWPRGDEDRAKEIGRTYITNDGSGSTRRGNYDACVCRRGTRRPPPGGTFTREGRVEMYPRRSYNVWRLIIRALLSCFPEEK